MATSAAGITILRLMVFSLRACAPETPRASAMPPRRSRRAFGPGTREMPPKRGRMRAPTARPCEGCFLPQSWRFSVCECARRRGLGAIIVEGARVSNDVSEALRESEQRYRTLFDQAPVGVFLYDRSLVITDFNPRFVEILRSRPERLRGLDMRTLRDPRLVPTLEKA